MKKIILSLTLSILTLMCFATEPHVNKVKVSTALENGKIKVNKLFSFSQVTGTGFAIHSSGYIATNFHVVEGQDEFIVKGINGDHFESYTAKLVKVDKENDLAILKISTNFGAIPYGFKTTKEDVAARVYAYGYPLTDLLGDEIKFTEGVISSNSGLGNDPRWYQHTATIQSGSSGGPLFNKYGNLVGINNAGINNDFVKKNFGIETTNINYAIKARYLFNLMEDLDLPILTNSGINNLDIQSQYKQIRKFVYHIIGSNDKSNNNSTSINSIKVNVTNSTKVNKTNSTVKWTGSKVASAHEGTINVKSGVLDFDHGLLVGGNFVIDMNSIKNTDIESEEYSAKLDKHLKNEDFFNVAEFPTAILTITNAKKRDGNDYYIVADLTIKGKTHPINFAAVVTANGLNFSAIANIKIDRTKWDVTYNSGNFFENLGDYLIKDEIEFDVFLLSVK